MRSQSLDLLHGLSSTAAAEPPFLPNLGSVQNCGVPQVTDLPAIQARVKCGFAGGGYFLFPAGRDRCWGAITRKTMVPRGLSSLAPSSALTGRSALPPRRQACVLMALPLASTLAVTGRDDLDPLEFMQRLAALVPRPRLPLIRFHSVLAPNAKLRSASVPRPAQNDPLHCADHADTPGPSAPARVRCARLLQRVFDIDIEHCPHCAGRLKIIAAPSAGSGQALRIPRSLSRSLPICTCPLEHVHPPRSPARSTPLIQAA